MSDSPPSPQILVVDDEPLNVELLERILRHEGFSVVGTTSPREALGLLERSPSIRLLLSDQRMPDMTGLDLLERAQRIAPGVMRVMVSGHADAEAFVGAINGGAVARWIGKPIESAELVKLAHEAVRGDGGRLRVIVLDPDEDRRTATLEALGRDVEATGYRRRNAPGARDALLGADVVVVTPQTEGGDSDLLRLSADAPRAGILLVAEGELVRSLDLAALGADDVVRAPVDPAEIRFRLRRTLSRARAQGRSRKADVMVSTIDRFGSMIGKSAPMRLIYDTIARVAPSDVTVIIYGETGTGKELVARTLHDESPRKRGPFVAVNCAAIPETLMESELFGHERGAFTGADRQRIGRFEAADAGTIFLDEIGELTPSLQVKLLRVLQEREIVRLGSGKPVPIDIRVVAATNVDLERAIKNGRFREDLYYRLNVVAITMPPLRAREGDVALLGEHFLESCQRRMGRTDIRFSERALEKLLRYSWPGNVRELQNVIEREVALVGPDAMIEDLELEERPMRPPASEPTTAGRGGSAQAGGPGVVWRGEPIRDLVARVEREVVEQALAKFGGNQARAAEALGITKQSLSQKLEKLRMR